MFFPFADSQNEFIYLFLYLFASSSRMRDRRRKGQSKSDERNPFFSTKSLFSAASAAAALFHCFSSLLFTRNALDTGECRPPQPLHTYSISPTGRSTATNQVIKCARERDGSSARFATHKQRMRTSKKKKMEAKRENGELD